MIYCVNRIVNRIKEVVVVHVIKYGRNNQLIYIVLRKYQGCYFAGYCCS